jgi:hypothetical protein
MDNPNPIPDTSKGYPVPAYDRPMGGPNSEQRQAAHAHRRRVSAKKQLAANGPSACIPGSGDPEDFPCRQSIVDNGES